MGKECGKREETGEKGGVKGGERVASFAFKNGHEFEHVRIGAGGWQEGGYSGEGGGGEGRRCAKDGREFEQVRIGAGGWQEGGGRGERGRWGDGLQALRSKDGHEFEQLQIDSLGFGVEQV